MFMSRPPGPGSPWPFQLLDYVYRPTRFLEASQRRFGPVFRIRLGRLGSLIIVHDPDHVAQVLRADSTILSAALSNDIARPIVGDRSVFLLDGEEHLARRKVLLRAFQSDAVRQHRDLIERVVCDRVERYRPGQRLVLHAEFNAMALEIIFRVVFGVSDSAELGTLDAAFRDLFRPMPAILSFLPSLQADFPGSPFSFWLKKRRRVETHLKSLIQARRMSHDRRGDVLSSLMHESNEAGPALGPDELVDELITAVVAGHETVATALAWAFELILHDGRVLERLTNEVLETAPSEIQSAPYLDACVSEVLRMRPVFPLVARGVRVPFQIGGYEIAPGEIVAPCLWLAHHDPRSYANPGTFSPERFLERRRDPYMFLPFGGGIRRCAGMAFAELEMKIVISTLLTRWVLIPDRPRLAPIVRRNVTLFPRGGTPVRIACERRP